MQADTEVICSRQDLLDQMAKLVTRLEKHHRNECFPKKRYPECPPGQAPEPIEVPHPYIGGVKLTNRPRAMRQNVKVTVDGRMAEIYEPREFYFEEPPIRVPPWFRPRIPSVELRAGIMMNGCECWKKNGLQDDCRRWDCGRPECLTKPLPECPPGFDPPLVGVRKGNAIMPPLMPKKKPILPPPPYPGPPEASSSKIEGPIPNPVAEMCPLHHQYLGYCR